MKVFHIASRASDVAPPAKKCNMNNPVSPSAAPSAAPDAAVAVSNESSAVQNISQMSSVKILVTLGFPTLNLVHRC